MLEKRLTAAQTLAAVVLIFGGSAASYAMGQALHARPHQPTAANVAVPHTSVITGTLGRAAVAPPPAVAPLVSHPAAQSERARKDRGHGKGGGDGGRDGRHHGDGGHGGGGGGGGGGGD